MSDTVIRARIEPELKAEALEIFKSIGLTPSAAIRMFLRSVVAEKALPHALKIPNAETLAAMDDVENEHNLTTYTSLEEMWKDLKIDA